jgi:transposase
MVVFLPKYHCGLNPIEQCWGYAKKRYREMPHANKPLVMEQYVLDAIDSIPIKSIQK